MMPKPLDINKLVSELYDNDLVKKFVKPFSVVTDTKKITVLEQNVTLPTKQDDIGYITLSAKDIEVTAEEYSFSARITKPQFLELENHGLNPDDKLNSTIYHEAKTSVMENVLNAIKTFANLKYKEPKYTLLDYIYKFLLFFKGKKYTKRYRILGDARDKSRQLISLIMKYSNSIAQDSRLGPATFIICSAKTHSILEDCQAYEYANNEKDPFFSLPLAKAGYIAGITVYIDPRMSFSDLNVYVGRKTTDGPGGLGLMYVTRPGSSELTKFERAEHNSFTYQLKTKFKVFDMGDNTKNLYNRFEWTDTKNF